MAIRIIAVGKKHESWVADGIERYSQRLRRPYDLEWVLLPHSAREGVMARQEESERLLLRLYADDFVIALDERGSERTSPELADLVRGQMDSSRQVVFVIGGAYGVDDHVRGRADVVWSLSRLVFPHQLVRLILSEQLYRAQEIGKGAPYHHD